VIPAEEQAQRQAALRALLAKPLLVASDDAESLMLVRRHLPALSGWLRKETGWRLTADAETARLFKTAPQACDATHPLADTTKSRSAAAGTSPSASPCPRSPAPTRRPRSAVSPTTCSPPPPNQAWQPPGSC
jgi:hypothetical protein